MSRDALYEDICQKLLTIQTTESMVELDKAHIGLRDQVERFALAHRRRLDYETEHKGYPKEVANNEKL